MYPAIFPLLRLLLLVHAGLVKTLNSSALSSHPNVQLQQQSRAIWHVKKMTWHNHAHTIVHYTCHVARYLPPKSMDKWITATWARISRQWVTESWARISSSILIPHVSTALSFSTIYRRHPYSCAETAKLSGQWAPPCRRRLPRRRRRTSSRTASASCSYSATAR